MSQPLLNQQVQNHYETLPELLADLSNTVAQFRKLNPSSIWYSTIDCSGDYHNFSFSTSSLSSLSTSVNGSLESTYENLEALNTELEYIREFLSTQEIGDYNFDYEILFNGSKPFLRVRLTGHLSIVLKQIPEELPPSSSFRDFLPYKDEVGRTILSLSFIPLTVVSSFYVCKKLGLLSTS